MANDPYVPSEYQDTEAAQNMQDDTSSGGDSDDATSSSSSSSGSGGSSTSSSSSGSSSSGTSSSAPGGDTTPDDPYGGVSGGNYSNVEDPSGGGSSGSDGADDSTSSGQSSGQSSTSDSNGGSSSSSGSSGGGSSTSGGSGSSSGGTSSSGSSGSGSTPSSDTSDNAPGGDTTPEDPHGGVPGGDYSSVEDPSGGGSTGGSSSGSTDGTGSSTGGAGAGGTTGSGDGSSQTGGRTGSDSSGGTSGSGSGDGTGSSGTAGSAPGGDTTPEDPYGGVPGGDYSNVEDPSGDGSSQTGSDQTSDGPSGGQSDEETTGPTMDAPDRGSGPSGQQDYSGVRDDNYSEDSEEVGGTPQQSAGGATPVDEGLQSPSGVSRDDEGQPQGDVGLPGEPPESIDGNDLTRDQQERLERTATELELQAIEESPAITKRSHVEVVERDGQLVTQRTEEGRAYAEQYREQQARMEIANQVEEETGVDTDIGDVRVEPTTETGASPGGQTLERAERLREAGEVEAANELLNEGRSGERRFDAEFSESLQRELAVQSFEEQFESETGRDIDPSDITVENTGDGYRARLADDAQRQQAAQTFEDRFEDQVGRDVSRDEFDIEQTEDGNFRAVPSSGDLRRDLQAEQAPGRRDDDIFSETVRAAEVYLGHETIAGGASGGGVDEFDIPGEGSEVNVHRREAIRAGEEQFGDYPVRIPDLPGSEEQQQRIISTARAVANTSGSPTDNSVVEVVAASEGKRLETVLKDASDTYQEDVVNPVANDVADVGSDAGTGPVSYGTPIMGNPLADEQQANQREQTERNFAAGLVQRAGAITDVPALVLTGKEAGEFAYYSVGEIAAGRHVEWAEQSAGAATLKAAQFSDTAYDKPARTSGLIAGSTVGSYGMIRGAQVAAGARAGRAVSFAIQPGEELAISAARSGVISSQTARAVPGVRSGHIRGSETSSSSGGGLDLRSPVRRVRERTPNVDVEIGRNVASSGRLEVNTNADFQRALVDAERSVARTPGRVGDAAGSATARLRESVRSGAESVRRTPEATSEVARDIADYTRQVAESTRPDVSSRIPSQQAIDDAAFRAGYRTQQDFNRLRGNVEGRVRGLLEADSPVPSQQTIDDAAFRAGYRAQQNVNRFRGGLQTTANDVAFRAGYGFQSGIDRGRDALSVDSPGLPDRPDLNSPVPSQQAIDDAAYRAGYRMEQNRRRGWTNTRERASGYRTEVEQRLARIRRDFGTPTRGGRVEDPSNPTMYEDDRGRGFTPMDVAAPAVAGGQRIASTFNRLRETNVRVDVGKPSRREVRASELDIDDSVGVEWEMDGTTIEFDQGGEVGRVSTDVEQDAGDGTVVRQEQEVWNNDARQARRVESEQQPTGVAVERVYGRAESDFVNEETTGAVQTPAPRSVEDATQPQIQQPGEFERQDLRPRVRQDQFEGRREVPSEIWRETGMETTTDTTGLEFGFEPAYEPRLRTPTEGEPVRPPEVPVETEPFGSGPDGDRRRKDRRGVSQFQFTNPIATPGDILL